jgi:PmbA protein
MDELLKAAAKAGDDAEVFHYKSNESSLSLKGGVVADASGAMSQGYALRMIGKGRMGTSYTKNLHDRAGLIASALTSLKGNASAKFHFPDASRMRKVERHDKRVEALGFSELYDYARQTDDFYEGKVKGQLNVYVGASSKQRTVANSNGLRRAAESTEFMLLATLVYPGGNTQIYNVFTTPGPQSPPRRALEDHIDTYRASMPKVRIDSGKYQVLFMPDALYPIQWRLSEGASGKNMHEKTSPLAGKVGEQVMSESVTIYDDPTEASRPRPVSFDDEGVATGRTDIVERGVFRTCCADLCYAEKLDMEPTGSGWRRQELSSADPITIQPAPMLRKVAFAPGRDRFEDMLGSMDRGIVVHGIMGPHSGNLLSGDFAVSLTPGFFVKKGEIVGRVRDGMISGNIYDMLRKVSGVENKVHYPDSHHGNPCILFDGVNVTAK